MPSTANATPQPFAELGPNTVLAALEEIGLRCDGRLQALNSFENRVYLVGLEDGGSRVAKFYRPGRWNRDQLLEEHRFAHEIAAAEIPLAAPLHRDALMAPDLHEEEEDPEDDAAVADTLFESHGFYIAVYRRQGGRVPELDNIHEGPAMRERIGQFIARIHQVGARHGFLHRPPLDCELDGWRSIERVTECAWLPPEVRHQWEDLARQCCTRVEARLHPTLASPGVADFTRIRLHGDCHLGNLLWTEAHGPHFVDLDGYEQIRPFERRELALVEPLRTLRIIRHSAWLAERWEDPAFPAAFPWFGSVRYWQGQIISLQEQLAQLQDL